MSKLGLALWRKEYERKVRALAPLAYWPLWEAAGLTAEDVTGGGLDGTYAGAGITYGQPGIGDGRTSVALDGNNTHVQLGNAAFAAAWDGDLFSALVWGRVDAAARWTDASTFRWLFHVRSSADATYYVAMGKNQTNHQLEWRRRSGGAIVSHTHTFAPAGPTGWFSMGVTCDVSLPLISWYLNGALLGTSGSAALTAWGANPPNDGATVLMAGSITLQEWIGWGAHAALWNRRLSDAAMAYLGSV